jgi:hypothetical protein
MNHFVSLSTTSQNNQFQRKACTTLPSTPHARPDGCTTTLSPNRKKELKRSHRPSARTEKTCQKNSLLLQALSGFLIL